MTLFFEPLQKGQAVKAHDRLALIEAFFVTTLRCGVPVDNLCDILPRFFDAQSYFVVKAAAKTELQENVRRAALLLTGERNRFRSLPFEEFCVFSGLWF